ncbi:MAG: hypothetical protein RIS29_189 [Bacteroidota bacterium]|jgi:hypothetical protein
MINRYVPLADKTKQKSSIICKNHGGFYLQKDCIFVLNYAGQRPASTSTKRRRLAELRGASYIERGTKHRDWIIYKDGKDVGHFKLDWKPNYKDIIMKYNEDKKKQ